MLVSAGKITMTPDEWTTFAAATFAPWVPRTVAEFNAMCILGSARHRAENTGGQGFLHALAAEEMQFGPAEQAHFPADPRALEYLKVHGVWPTPEQLRGTDPDGQPPGPHLRIVR